jgi:hypothetical protein
VETDCHDAIRCVECFFDTVAVMDVNVDVKYTRVIPGAKRFVSFVRVCEQIEVATYRSNSRIPSTMSLKGGLTVRETYREEDSVPSACYTYR